MARAATAPTEDFDPKDLIKVVTEHDEMRSRLDNLEKLDNFTAAFCKAASEHTKIRECLNGAIVYLIQKDEVFRDEIRKLIKETDSRTYKMMLVKLGWGVWTGIIFILGLITEIIIKKLTNPSH